MAILESQLNTWSHQGSTTQSAATYRAIRQSLLDSSAPFAQRSFSVFLQGSYGNDTNIYADSDVDVVICLDSVYYSDTSQLNEQELARYNAAFVPATYSFSEFKREVFSWLQNQFGLSVRMGTKAIYIPADGGRREVDVLVCAEQRRYVTYPPTGSPAFHEGIIFWTTSGEEVENFPSQHSANCTAKHQRTSAWFKPTVRVLKNMRNAMRSAGLITDGLAPSYVLEGMLWNVPDATFAHSFQRAIPGALDWLRNCESSNLTCANGLHWLLRDGASMNWRQPSFDDFLYRAKIYWDI